MHVVPSLQLVPLDASHLAFAARLHVAELRSGIFPRLGQRFLGDYYQTFIESPHAVAFVALVGGTPVGALVGTVDNAAHYRWVLRSRLVRLLCSLAAALIVRPMVAARFIRTRAHRYIRGARLLAKHRPNAIPVGTGDCRRAVLTHVAVLPEARGTGAGRTLVTRFVESVQSTDSSVIAVVTASGVEGARAFYEHLGWSFHREGCDVDGEKVTHLVYSA